MTTDDLIFWLICTALTAWALYELTFAAWHRRRLRKRREADRRVVEEWVAYKSGERK